MGRKQDFSQATIYHIRVIETKMVAYVGSTTNFKQRCASHKHDFKRDCNYPLTNILEIMEGLICLKSYQLHSYN